MSVDCGRPDTEAIDFQSTALSQRLKVASGVIEQQVKAPECVASPTHTCARRRIGAEAVLGAEEAHCGVFAGHGNPVAARWLMQASRGL